MSKSSTNLKWFGGALKRCFLKHLYSFLFMSECHPGVCTPPCSQHPTSTSCSMVHSKTEHCVVLCSIVLWEPLSSPIEKQNMEAPQLISTALEQTNERYSISDILKEDFSPASPSFFPLRLDKEENVWIKIAFISHSKSSLFPVNVENSFLRIGRCLRPASPLPRGLAPGRLCLFSPFHAGWLLLLLPAALPSSRTAPIFCWTDPARSVGQPGTALLWCHRCDATASVTRDRGGVLPSGAGQAHIGTQPGPPECGCRRRCRSGTRSSAGAVAVAGPCAARSARGRASVRRPGGYIVSRWVSSPNEQKILNSTAFLTKTSIWNPSPACEFSFPIAVGHV